MLIFKKHNSRGFTLLEILLVTGIIGILTAIVIIAINPGRSLAKARDVQRKVGITEINKGLEQYYIDHNQYPASLSGPIGSLQGICNTGASATSTGINCIGMVDLSMLVPTYLPSIPIDPTGVGYKVGFNSSRRIMLVADLTETVSPLIAIGTTTYPVVAVAWTCGSTFTDSRDSKVYTTVLIGSQCWMAQNLNVGVPLSPAWLDQADNGIIEKYCYSSGCFYQWDEMMGYSHTPGTQGICPTGWHIPTDTEYKTLVEGQATPGCESGAGWQCPMAGAHLSTSTDGENYYTKGDNSSGFTALLVGFRESLLIDHRGGATGFWSSSESEDGVTAWARFLFWNYNSVFRGLYEKNSEVDDYSLSVRCVKD